MKGDILKNNNGQIIIPALLFGAIAVMVVTGFVSWGSLNLQMARKMVNKEIALQIAEAGNDYYRWHLAHAPQDYQDGTGSTGPYVHEFKDKDGKTIGNFSLDITAPSVGSTEVKVKSSGSVSNDASVSRKIETLLAIPTMARFAIVTNSDVRFGVGTEVFGPIHSNGGIRFDGLAHNIVSSTKQSYKDPDSPYDTSFGVHTHVAPADPTVPPSPQPLPTLPLRSDVFQAGRRISVSGVDFAGLTPDLQKMKTDAQSGGLHIPGSGASGYHMVLNTNDTLTLYKVTRVRSAPAGCSKGSTDDNYWGLWSIQNENLVGMYNFPNNGIIFVEDHVWVDGKISSARLTIASARFPDVDSTRTSITVNKSLLYSNYDGTDSIGLIAQRNVNIGYDSDNDIRIDAAMIAQNGRTGRYFYGSNCGTSYKRNSLILFGMLASNTRYGFSWTNSGVYASGYKDRNINYDANLLYGAPPSFPLTGDQYQTISWEEVK